MPTVLITGSTDGMGRLLAERFAQMGWRLFLHGRNRAKLRDVAQELATHGANVVQLLADMSEVEQVCRLADAAREEGELDLLINNAAVGFGVDRSERELSLDGIELRWAVNYLAPFLLSNLLAESLCRSRIGGIVNVASAGQEVPNLNDLGMVRNYDGRHAYNRSKFALIAHTLDLADFYVGRLCVNAIHPATYMNTRMVAMSGITPASTVETGVHATLGLVHGIMNQRFTGLYFSGEKVAAPHPGLMDSVLRADLRKATWRILGPLTLIGKSNDHEGYSDAI